MYTEVMSSVISIRIPEELKRELDKLDEDWREEVRQFLYELVRRKRREKALEKAKELRDSIGRKGTPVAELIRVDRDE